MTGHMMTKTSLSSENLLDPEHQTRTHAPNSSCRFFLMGLTSAFFAATLTLVICQVTMDTSHFTIGSNFKRPAIAADQKGLQDGITVASGGLLTTWPDPPPKDQVAKVARYVVHTSDWGTIATFSTQKDIAGFPFGNIVSISDGPIDKSSGTPYMYLTPLDLSAHDLQNDSRASLTLTEAQSDYCHKKDFDPQDPRCARILITGQIVKVENGTADWSFAEAAMFTRHPAMKSWHEAHEFFFAKLNILNIFVLDYYGGAVKVDVNDYFNTVV